MTVKTIKINKRFHPVEFKIKLKEQINRNELNLHSVYQLKIKDNNEISIETFHFKNCMDYLKELYEKIILNYLCELKLSIIIFKSRYKSCDTNIENILDEIVKKVKNSLSSGFDITKTIEYDQKNKTNIYIAYLEYDISFLRFYNEEIFKNIFDLVYQIFIHERDRISMLLTRILNKSIEQIDEIEIQAVLKNNYNKFNVNSDRYE